MVYGVTYLMAARLVLINSSIDHSLEVPDDPESSVGAVKPLIRVIFFQLLISIAFLSCPFAYSAQSPEPLAIVTDQKQNDHISLDKFKDIVLRHYGQGREWTEEFRVRLEYFTTIYKPETDEERILTKFYSLCLADYKLRDDLIIRKAPKIIGELSLREMPEAVICMQFLYASYRRANFLEQRIDLMEQMEKLDQDLFTPAYGLDFNHELGLIYYELGRYQDAIEQFKIKMEKDTGPQPKMMEASALNNIALAFKKSGQTDSALYYYKNAKEKLETFTPEPESKFDEAYKDHFSNVIQSNIAQVEFSRGNSGSEVELAFMAELESSRQVREFRITAQALNNLAELYLERGNYNQAEIYLDSAMLHHKKYQFTDSELVMHKLHLRTAIAKRDSLLAYASINRIDSLRDSILKQQLKRRSAEAAAKYDYIRAQERLDSSKKALEQQQSTDNVLQALLLALSAIFLLIIFYLVRSRKQNKIIDAQRAELQNSLREKALLLDEVHHRIKNNLQTVSGILELQNSRVDNQQLHLQVEQSQKYLQSITLVHELLHRQDGMERLDMCSYFNQLTGLLANHGKHPDIQVSLDCDNVFLNSIQATPLGLITAELVTNSIKHAVGSGGTICITLTCTGRLCTFTYSDSGTGTLSNERSYDGIGMDLITLLAEEMEADLHINENYDYRINFNTTDG